MIEALDALAASVLKDRNRCGWVNHPMPGYKQYQGRVWKWDFEADPGAQSTSRPGWRLFALAQGANPTDHPMPADAFFLYDKNDEPKGNPVKWIVEELKKFLLSDAPRIGEEDRFRRVNQPDGSIRSLCMSCCETVFVSMVEAELDLAEQMHQCGT